MVSVATAAATLATATYLTRVHGWSTLTAILAGMPGGLVQVMARATEADRDSDVPGVAIVQTLQWSSCGVRAGRAVACRTGFGHPNSGRCGQRNPGSLRLCDAGRGIDRGRARAIAAWLPGRLIFGPMVVSALFHGFAVIAVTMPFPATTVATIGLGVASGGRFTGTPFRLCSAISARARVIRHFAPRNWGDRCRGHGRGVAAAGEVIVASMPPARSMR